MNTLRIISYSDEPFRNRLEAGQLLGHELRNWRGQSAVVLGIPRGGLIVARELARVLDADLDIVLSRKLRAPGNPELAIGAVTEDGKLFLDEMLIREMGVESTYIRQEKERQLLEIARRTEQSRQILPKVPLKGRLVIVTDDGVATGATMQAALWAARQEHPKKLIAALPVGPEETVRRLAQDADEMICLRTPSFFSAVGEFYIQFDQVEDEEMLTILREEHQRKGRRVSSKQPES
jgi:predicted phosphoribosyltransferase